jgi:hypothetical protein
MIALATLLVGAWIGLPALLLGALWGWHAWGERSGR